MSYKKPLTVRKDGTFRIMQIADAQELPYVSSDTIKLIRLAVQREKPDLVIFTGDQLYGPIPLFRHRTKQKARHVIETLLSPVEKAGIPFLVTFGNHDDECGIPNGIQADFYDESPYCAGGNYLHGDRLGVSRIPIYNADGNECFSVYLFDSGKNFVNERQLEAFRSLRTESFEKNGRHIPHIAFQHIPVSEYMETVLQVDKHTKNAVRNYRADTPTWLCLPEEAVRNGEFMGESPAVPRVNHGELDALTEEGHLLGLFVGHDHVNSFARPYKNTLLCYTQGAGFNVYGPGRKRGVRMITLSENNPDTVRTNTVTFEDLTDDRPKNFLFEGLMPLVPTSTVQLKYNFKIAAFVTSGITATGIITFLIKRGKRNV